MDKATEMEIRRITYEVVSKALKREDDEKPKNAKEAKKTFSKEEVLEMKDDLLDPYRHDKLIGCSEPTLTYLPPTGEII